MSTTDIIAYAIGCATGSFIAQLAIIRWRRRKYSRLLFGNETGKWIPPTPAEEAHISLVRIRDQPRKRKNLFAGSHPTRVFGSECGRWDPSGGK